MGVECADAFEECSKLTSVTATSDGCDSYSDKWELPMDNATCTQ